MQNEKIEIAFELETIQFLGREMRNFMVHGSNLTGFKVDFLGMRHDGECMMKIRYTYDRNTNAADRDTDKADAMRRYVAHISWLK
jgi:hypothetical protein